MENQEKAVAVKEKAELVPMQFTPDQVDLIKTTVARGTDNNQLALFLYTCKRTGLDPLAKQIHCIVRQTKNGPVMSIQTAIDGYRLVADRSGKYAGNDDPIYDDEEKPQKATVTVYKIVSGVRCPFTATARWSQYYPGDLQGFMWKKMPHLMLGKCAEALALRKAFPAELSGVYTKEEMEQAEDITPHSTVAEPIAHPAAPTPAKHTQTAALASAAPKADGPLTVTGILAKHFPPKGASKHHSYTLEGVDGYFQTANATDIETLNGHGKQKDTIELTYTETPWEKNGRSGVNRTITGIAVMTGDAQE